MTHEDLKALKHYGVKGMRWGIRNGKGRARAAAAAQREVIKAMSDEELRTRINRIKMERELSSLISGSQSSATTAQQRIEKGRKFVDEVLNSVNTAKKVYEMYDDPMVKKVRAAMVASNKASK